MTEHPNQKINSLHYMSARQLKKSVLLGVFLVAAALSCTARKRVDFNPEGSKMLAEVKETWGYGCGGNCSFNSDGSYSTVLSFGEYSSVVMETSGQFAHVVHYPDSFIFDAKKWSYEYQGSWQDSGDAIRLDLNLLKKECVLQRSQGSKKTVLPCEKLSGTKIMNCKIDKAPVEGSSKQALFCRDEDENETVFGIGEPVTKVIVGEPSIKVHFYEKAKR